MLLSHYHRPAEQEERKPEAHMGRSDAAIITAGGTNQYQLWLAVFVRSICVL